MIFGGAYIVTNEEFYTYRWHYVYTNAVQVVDIDTNEAYIAGYTDITRTAANYVIIEDRMYAFGGWNGTNPDFNDRCLTGRVHECYYLSWEYTDIMMIHSKSPTNYIYPTMEPTLSPTIPTINPTNSPSKEPTTEPTTTTTAVPTTFPSNNQDGTTGNDSYSNSGLVTGLSVALAIALCIIGILIFLLVRIIKRNGMSVMY